MKRAIFLGTDAVSITEGRVVTPDMSRLAGAFNVPMAITAAHVHVKGYPVPGAITARYAAGDYIHVKFTVGRHELTSGFVPLERLADYYADGYINGTGQESVVVSAKWQSYSRFYWRFPKPLFTSPGQPIVPSFHWPLDYSGALLSGVRSTTHSIVCAFQGYLLDRAESRSVIPWVSCWVPGEDDVQSGELPLKNTTGGRVHAVKLTGGMANLVDATEHIPRPDLTTITFQSGRGHFTVANRVPFSHIFHRAQTSLPLGVEMEPGDLFQVKLESEVDYDKVYVGNTIPLYPTVALHAYREEAIG